MRKFLNRYFQIDKKGSTIGREILAGAIVFLAMLYILPVNTSILGHPVMGMNANGVFVATAIASGVATLIMGLVARYPVVLSAGMGMNAYLAFTVCGNLGYSWQQAMALIFVAGLIFLVLTLTPIRKLIIKAIPKDIKFIISAGLGCFIAFIGLKGAGIITSNPETLVTLGSLSNPVVLLGLFGILLVFGLMFVQNKMVRRLSIVIAMFATAFLGFILGLCGVADMPHFIDIGDISKWGFGSLASIKEVALFGGEWDSIIEIMTKPETYAIIFALTFVNIFDTTATLLAVGKDAGILDEKGELRNGNIALLADASGSVICAPLGTSTVTSFAESTIGIEVGGRTGLTAVTAGLLFLLAIVIGPVFTIFYPVGGLTPVTSMALVCVGSLIFTSNLKDIDWKDTIITITAFLTMIFMMLTYSLADGLGLGLIIYIIMMVANKRYKEIHPILYGVAGFFLLSFGVKELVGILSTTKETGLNAEIVVIDSLLSLFNVVK